MTKSHNRRTAHELALDAQARSRKQVDKSFEITLTEAQHTALAVFAGQYRVSAGSYSPQKRAIASDGLRKAMAALSRAEAALVTMVCINGTTIGDTAKKSGLTRADLMAMLVQAAGKLANHYEAIADG